MYKSKYNPKVGNVDIEYKEGTVGDYKGRVVSARKAKRELNWESKLNLGESCQID